MGDYTAFTFSGGPRSHTLAAPSIASSFIMTVLNCGCGADDYDDYSRRTVSTTHTIDTDESSHDSAVLNTDYRKATPLFRHIEKENWEGVLMFLTSGKWSDSMLVSSNEHLRSPAPHIQVKTWVTSYDRRGEAEWSQLPLHAAISYLAPFVVIQKLVEMYPKAVQCTDNEGMLPIHLAFGFGAPDSVLALLLEPFPASVNEKGLGDRRPHECCELGPNKVRGRVFKIVTDETKKRILTEIDHEWRDFVDSAKKGLGLADADVNTSEKKLTEFLLELLRDRKELNDLKGRARARPVAPASPAHSKASQRSGRIGRVASFRKNKKFSV